MERTDLDTLARSFSPGERVFLPGSCGEHPAFTAALAEASGAIGGLELTTSFVPGVNCLPLEALAPDVRVRALFPPPGCEAAVREGRLRLLPASYAGFVRDLRHGPPFDAVVVHVAPPDGDGRCSLALAAEFTSLAASRARRVLAVVNPRLPRLQAAPSIRIEQITLACEAEGEPPTYLPGEPDAAALALAHGVAALIPDGAVLQLGLGKSPAALAAALRGHKGLRFWSGMLSDGWLDLAAAGALAEGVRHVACAAVGSRTFYAALAERDDVRIAGCEVTHAAAELAAQSPLYAVNSALQVDLFGQCNLEQADGRLVSGAGGAPDFARAASKGAGASIVALAATGGRDRRSRIVAQLDGVTSLARHEVDVVATEHGAADLRGLDADARAAAIIGVAAPPVREDLARAWRNSLRAGPGAGA